MVWSGVAVDRGFWLALVAVINSCHLALAALRLDTRHHAVQPAGYACQASC